MYNATLGHPFPVVNELKLHRLSTGKRFLYSQFALIEFMEPHFGDLTSTTD